MLQGDQRYNFAPAPPLEGNIGDFAFRLVHKSAEFTPTAQFMNIEVARAALEPMLATWRVSSILQFGPAGFDFVFVEGYVDDSPQMANNRRQNPRNWPPDAPTITSIGYDQFPKAFDGLAVNECVLDLADHYLTSSRSLRSQLLHAYAMVTRIEQEYGGQRKAAIALQLSTGSLTRLSRLATERGLGAAARNSIFMPLVSLCHKTNLPGYNR